MNPREQRGILIAAQCKLTVRNGRLVVPSQSESGIRYTVNAEAGTSTCPEHAETGHKCKHQWAVEYTVNREQQSDGTITETRTLTVAERKTYAQDWPNYNAAQVNERRHFHDLLGDLCGTIPEPERYNRKGGRPSIPVRDSIYSAVLKVYSLMSARRFSGELEEAHNAGHIRHLPHFNSVLNVFDKEGMTPILRNMIETSAAPLQTVETKFAVDSTGFATIKYAAWFDHKYGVERKEAQWVKAHFATGVKTNIVTACTILEQDSADSPQFPELVHTTAKTFTVGQVSADKAYGAVANFDAVDQHGGKFFPAFRANATGACGGLFEKAFHYFSFKKEEYLNHYHQRSNVESTVSMVKRKFGDAVKAKNETAQKNEVHAKFVCHNICVLIAEMYALGIEADFGLNGCTKAEGPAQILRFPAR